MTAAASNPVSVEPDLALAEYLFDALAERTAAERGVSRPSYGRGEQIAHGAGNHLLPHHFCLGLYRVSRFGFVDGRRGIDRRRFRFKSFDPLSYASGNWIERMCPPEVLERRSSLPCFFRDRPGTQEGDGVVRVELERPRERTGSARAVAESLMHAAGNRPGRSEVVVPFEPASQDLRRPLELTRAVGKALAMDVILTGRFLSAREAETAGLVSRVVALDSLLDEAVGTAAKIAKLSRPVVMMAKEAVNRACETTLAEGVKFERRLFHSTFATEDRKEGMSAFADKRKPAWKHR